MLSIHTHEHTDEFHHRHFLRFVYGYTVRRVTEFQPDGVTPAEIKITYRDNVYLRPEFLEGSDTYVGRPARGGRDVTVRMLDDARQPTAVNPAYFELTLHDGEKILMIARGGKNRPFGAVVMRQSPEGDPVTLADLGIQIFTDGDGVIEQVLTPTHFAVVEDTDSGSYTVIIYDEIEKNPPVLHEGRYIAPEGLDPFLQAWVENPGPYEKSDLRIYTRRSRGEPTYYQWTVNPLGDYDLDRCDENWEVTHPWRRRWYSDDGKYFFRQRGTVLCGGTIRVTTERSERIAGNWHVMERHRKIGDRETADIHYAEPASHRGKIKHRLESDGNWVAYDYNERGFRTLEIRPVATHRTVIEYVPDPSAAIEETDDLLGGLLDSFSDGAPPGKRRMTRHVTDYDPPAPPEVPAEATHLGEVRIHGFEHPDPDAQRPSSPSRPAVTTFYRNGKFEKRVWYTPETDPEGRNIVREQTATCPDAAYGDPGNRITVGR
ncbi:MAG: hypothetical protein JJU05_00630 [Verrucomicrobia bacterium]|nr:hypothetical protein [Verrucomicrobiota bacterium]MCH8526332.1 hypothetical protein [Kiritimatiellia bacterium]